MYTFKADGQVFYDPASDDMAYHVITPKLKLDVKKSSSLSFIMLPGNVAYDSIRKMKTIITAEQDGEVVFRGRATEATRDLYNQKDMYCESDLSFLLDSQQRPFSFEGKASDFLALMVANHNEQVDEDKRFTIGMVTAVDDSDTVKVSSNGYLSTMESLNSKLVAEHEGYLRTRHVDGVTYLDYIDDYHDDCDQPIEFGVNLVNIEMQVNANDLCTVMIPLGQMQGGSRRLTIKSVNNGLDYIEDAEGIAQYGRIVKTCTWEDVNDATKLLEKGREQFDKIKASLTTRTITALDLHHLNVDTSRIKAGSKVQMLSAPHDLDYADICTVADIDIENPDRSVYTFGKPLETMSDSAAATSRGWGHDHLHLTETETTLQVYIEATDKALSDVQILCDGLASQITMKADKILLDAYVKATDLETETLKVLESARVPDLKALAFTCSGTANISQLNATNAIIGSLAPGEINIASGGTIKIPSGGLIFDGYKPKWNRMTVMTGATLTQSKRYLNIMLADGSTTQLDIVTDVKVNNTTDSITYLYRGDAVT